MAQGQIKKCGVCNSPLDEAWTKHDDDGHYVCPYCGNVNDFSDNEKRQGENDELNEIFILLDNAQFQVAASKLRILREKYPNSSKAYFLSVLADNRVCYTKDSSQEGHYIPTLNDLPSNNLLESPFAKKALELAPSDVVRDSYRETLEYIESKRLEIQKAAAAKENQYDVFISTKVTELDENDREILDALGNPKQSKDCVFAFDLYNTIRGEYPGLRVFFSQSNEAKEKMAGNKFENIIYAALHSAKAFILVSESRQNIEWRWVRNEWMRYLMIMDRSEPGTRNFTLVTHDIKPNELPRELQGFQFINYNAASAYKMLSAFLNRSLFKEETKKIEAKTFSNEVEKVKIEEIEDTIVTRKLKAKAEVATEDEKANLERIFRDLDPSDEYSRNEAFEELAEMLERNPNIYEAKKLMLLKGTDYYHFEDYIGKISEIIEHPEIATQFFEFATVKDAKDTIVSLAKQLSNSSFCFGFGAAEAKKEKNIPVWAEKYSFALTNLILPYLDNISKQDLDSLANRIEKLVLNGLDYSTDSQKALVENYLALKGYQSGKDAKPYIDVRKKYLESLSRFFPRLPDVALELQSKVVDEVLKVNPAEYETMWIDLSLKNFGKVYSVKESLEALEKGDIEFSIVGNKENLDTFKNILKYTRDEERKWYTYAFLTFIINDRASYEKEEGQDTLVMSKDQDGDDQLDDYELNGFDLFNKYIPYELPTINFKSTLSEELDEHSPLFSPNEDAYLKKKKPLPIDKLINSFAVKLHRENLYDPAAILYDLYLGQQDSVKTFDSLLIRYYKELATVRVVEVEELKHIGRTLQHKAIDTDIIQLEKTLPQVGVLYSAIKKVTAYQRQYFEVYSPIKELTDQLPRENTIDKTQMILDIKDKIEKALSSVSKDVRQDLEKDFSVQLDYFKKKLPQLVDATKRINEMFKDEDLSNIIRHLTEKGDGRKKAEEMIGLVDAYDEPVMKNRHINLLNQAKSVLEKNKKRETAARVKRQQRERAKENAEAVAAATAVGAWVFIRALLLLIWPLIALTPIYAVIDLAWLHMTPDLDFWFILGGSIITIIHQIVVSCFTTDHYEGWVETFAFVSRAIARVVALVMAVSLFAYAWPVVNYLFGSTNPLTDAQTISLVMSMIMLVVLTINLYLERDGFSTHTGGLAYIFARGILLLVPAVCLVTFFSSWGACFNFDCQGGCGCTAFDPSATCVTSFFGITSSCIKNTASTTSISLMGGWSSFSPQQMIGLFVGLVLSGVWSVVNTATHITEEDDVRKIYVRIGSGICVAVTVGYAVFGLLTLINGLVAVIFDLLGCVHNGCGNCVGSACGEFLSCGGSSSSSDCVTPTPSDCTYTSNLNNLLCGLGFTVLGAGTSYICIAEIMGNFECESY